MIIGGISDNITSDAAIRSMIDQIKANLPGVEILLTSGPNFNNDEASVTGQKGNIGSNFGDVLNPAWTDNVLDLATTKYRRNLYEIALAKDVGFLDLRGVWGDYLRQLNTTGGWTTDQMKTLYRDGNHFSTYGKEVMGRAVATYLQVPVPEPTAVVLLAPMMAMVLGGRRDRREDQGGPKMVD